jgi:hypothetical protein
MEPFVIGLTWFDNRKVKVGRKPRKPGLGRALLSLSHINAAHAKRAWERERGCQKSEAFCVPPKQDSYFIFAVHDWFLFSIGEMKAGHSCIFFGMVKENLLRAIPNTHSLCAKPEFSFVIWSPFQAAACVWLWFFWLIMFMLKALTQKK